MKGLTMVGVGCALFLAAQVSVVDAAEETLQNYAACNSRGIGCKFGNPNDFVECFNNATLTSPFKLTEASYTIWETSSDTLEPLTLVVYGWDGPGKPPGAVITTMQLTLAESLAGEDGEELEHTVVLNPTVSLPTANFCIGVSGNNLADWFRISTSTPNTGDPTSWLYAPLCGVTTITDMNIHNLGNWCMTATIEEEIVDTTIEVDIDIKFCDDPNSHNCKNKGALPVVIFGTGSFNVASVDASTLRLCLEDLTTCTGGPKDWSVSDRGDPNQDIGAAMCAVNPDTGQQEDFLNQDGIPDLNVTFESSDIRDTLLVDFCNQPKGTISPTLFIVGITLAGDAIVSMPVDDVAVDQLEKVNR